MDIHILNSSFETTTIVDSYNSFIWTERYIPLGDIELVVPSTFANRQRLPLGAMVSIKESKRVMVLETVENTTSEEGEALLKYKGRSLEVIFEQRLAWFGLIATDANNKKWVISELPCVAARSIFEDICITGVISTGDIIPGVSTDSIFPEDTIPEPGYAGPQTLDPATLLETLTKLAQAYNFGFRLVRETDTPDLYFNIYTGVDRTTLQEESTAIIFSPSLDNVFNTSELASIQTAKNVAYILSDRGASIVYAPGVDPSVAGFDRRALYVRADIPEDTDTVTYDVPTMLQQAGDEALAQAKGVRAFDGEVRFPEDLVYGIGYNLGDLVELRNTDGEVTYKRVTEYIFVSDAEGDRSYPTLTENAIEGLVTWSTFDDDLDWSDFTTEAWDGF